MSVRVDLYEGARIALKSLRSNRMRTVLTTLGIGIGVATLLAIVGIIQGLNASFQTQLNSIGTTYFQVSKFPWGISGNWWEYRNRKNLDVSLVSVIKSQSKYATAVSPMTWKSCDVGFMGEQISSVGVIGATEDYRVIMNAEITRGRFISDLDDAATRRVAVLGADVTDGLFPGMDPIGKNVLIDGRPYTVIGTAARKGKILDENMDLMVVIPFKTHQANLARRKDIRLTVAIASPEVVTRAEDELVGILRRARGTPPDQPDDFSINRTDKLVETYNKLTGALYGVAVGIGFITLLVGGIGIMNIMLVSVRERTREIGVRRALGARRRTIIAQFLMEAAAVSGLGGLLGTIVGLAGAKIVSEITPLAAAVQPLTILFGVGFASFVGLLFGIWPAARAASLDPVEALRYE